MTHMDCVNMAKDKIKKLLKTKKVGKQDEIAELVKNIYNEEGMTETIRQICEIAITKKDAILCYKLAVILYKERIMNDLQNVVLEDKNVKLCYLFARDVKRANVKKLEKVVLEEKNPILSYLFALNVKHANVKEHEKVVVDSNEVLWCYMFAYFVDNAKIEPLQQVVLNGRDENLCRQFALYIAKSNLGALLNVKPACDVEKVEKELDSIINEL